MHINSMIVVGYHDCFEMIKMSLIENIMYNTWQVTNKFKWWLWNYCMDGSTINIKSQI